MLIGCNDDINNNDENTDDRNVNDDINANDDNGNDGDDDVKNHDYNDDNDGRNNTHDDIHDDDHKKKCRNCNLQADAANKRLFCRAVVGCVRLRLDEKNASREEYANDPSATLII